MRLTIYVDETRPGEHAPDARFAVLWLDLDEGVWSRESHAGVDLPSWGRLIQGAHTMSVCAAEPGTPLCTLYGLSRPARTAVASRSGRASWSASTGFAVGGRWHLQAVDTEQEIAVHSEFRS
jgi:hypothetical protein